MVSPGALAPDDIHDARCLAQESMAVIITMAHCQAGRDKKEHIAIEEPTALLRLERQNWGRDGSQRERERLKGSLNYPGRVRSLP